MEKNKFKVGDIVKFNFRGKECTGEVVEVNSGRDKISNLVMLFGDAKGHGHSGNCYSQKAYKTSDYWFFWDKELELIAQKEIHITTDGTTTHAILKQNGKLVNRAKAVCSPEDVFDFETGARLAIDRVLGVQAKEEVSEYVQIIKTGFHTFKKGTVLKVIGTDNNDYICEDIGGLITQYVHKNQVKMLKTVKRTAKKGEYILLTEPRFSFDRKGDVLKVDLLRFGYLPCVFSENHPNSKEIGYKTDWHYEESNYTVLEGYEPIKEFVPHLEKDTGIHYGELGEATPFKDVYGKSLYVGDIVIVINSKGKNVGERFVVKRDGRFFIFGISLDCDQSGEIGGRWILIKKESFENLKHLMRMNISSGFIKAVLKED